ncbi:hypothetical protein P3H15_48885 [Rhodococcus sp. T2V]|uniref:hypothetical protein n=1 Tax=Rhodococcus sp. T2V TaxID=3034164 RepID=UPI0023E1F9B5|nr:hypothetical protein [Rhodococcus sp. T2V]MDF3312854.1 hypothetical protein [Rhodococcus sp. T2V]
MSDGSLSGDLTFVVNRFQREIEAALPAALAEQGIGKIELVSITEGSAVLHMKPVFATSVEQDGLEIDAESLFDGAVRKVLDVHDALEEGAVAAELPGNEKKLLDAVRLMTEELAEHDVNLEVSALEGRGNRRLSRLSRVGISHAVHLFERTVQKEKQQIGGYVHTVSLDGRLTLAASTRKRAHKSVIEQVPSALIRAGSFPLGEYMRVAVDAEIKTDALGNRPETKYKFSEILAHSPEASL